MTPQIEEIELENAERTMWDGAVIKYVVYLGYRFTKAEFSFNRKPKKSGH